VITGDPIADNLINAGLQILISDPAQTLDRGLRSEDAINLADSSPASFYRKFATKTDFLSAVLQELPRTPGCDPDNLHTELAGHLTTSNKLIRPAIRAVVDAHYEALTERSAVTRQILVHAYSNANSASAQAIRSAYGRRDMLILAAFDVFTEQFGATLRKPLAPRSFAVLLTALLDGFALRSRVDRGVVSAELLTDAVLSLIGATFNRSDNHGHIDDVLKELTHTPPPRPVPRDMRAAMVAAAKSEFGKRGYFSANLDDIAGAAGVPVTSARRLFPTKPHIIVAALRSHVAALAEGVADDVLVDLDEVTIIENHLLRSAHLVADETVFMDALLVAIAHDTFAEPEGLLALKEELNIPAIIAPIVAQGQEKGVFDRLESPRDVAAGIMNMLFIRCFTRRDRSPEANAKLVGSLILRGLLSGG
jgi:AcrR family transcriptional regulator